MRIVSRFRAGVSLLIIAIGLVAALLPPSRPPAEYARLSAHGTRAEARFAGCYVTKPANCRLALAYAGKTRTWTYPQDYAQFSGVHTGDPVPVLVDPRDPLQVYTVHDVEVRYMPGFSGRRGVGIVAVIFGAVLLVSSFVRPRRARR